MPSWPTATESESVSVLDRPRSDPAWSVDKAAFALLLVWLIALAMPAAQVYLPPEAKDIPNGYCTTVALALAITWRVRDQRKR